jgi:hypothetical protein
MAPAPLANELAKRGVGGTDDLGLLLASLQYLYRYYYIAELEPGGAPPNVPSRIEETISIRCLPTSQHPFYRAHDILGYYLDYLPTPYVDP